MSVRRNISFSYVLQVLNTGLGFIASIFITRLLGPDGRRGYSLFINAVSLISIWLGFSLPSSVIFYIASKKYDVGKIFNTMILFTILSSAIVFISVQIILRSGLGWMIFPVGFNGLEWQLLFIIQFFLTQINNLVVAFLNGKKVFITSYKIGVISTFFSVLIWILIYKGVIHIQSKPFGIVVIISTIILLFQVVANLAVWLRSDFSFSKKLMSLLELKSILKFAFLVYICNSIQYLSYRMDLWFVDYYHGKSDTGVYSLAVTLAQLVWILPNAIASVLYSYMASSNQNDALLYLNKYVRVSFYASLLISVCAFTLFYFTVPLIYGKGFTKSAIMIGILLIGIVPFSIPILAGSLFAGIHKVKYNFFASSIGFVVCLILDIALIPKYGAMGACYATVLSYLSNTIYCVYIIKFVLDGNVNISPKHLIDQDIKTVVSILRTRFRPTKLSNIPQ